jgi:hypothetical protein
MIFEKSHPDYPTPVIEYAKMRAFLTGSPKYVRKKGKNFAYETCPPHYKFDHWKIDEDGMVYKHRQRLVSGYYYTLL